MTLKVQEYWEEGAYIYHKQYYTLSLLFKKN